MVDALREKGIPVAYVTVRGRAARLPARGEHPGGAGGGARTFYGRIFGFEPAGDVAAVVIENLAEPPSRGLSAQGRSSGRCRRAPGERATMGAGRRQTPASAATSTR